MLIPEKASCFLSIPVSRTATVTPFPENPEVSALTALTPQVGSSLLVEADGVAGGVNGTESTGSINAKWSVSQITSWFRRTFGRRRWTPKKARQGKDAAMPGPRPVLCTFPEDFLQEAIDTVGRRTVAVQTVQRFRLVLLLHERPSLGNDEAAAAVGLSARQVQRWRSRWATGDFSVEDHPGRGRKAAFSPSGSSVDPSDGL